VKETILNELLDENLVARINAYLDQRSDNEKVTLRASVTINVPVRLPVYKDGAYSGSNIYEDMLDCAAENLEGASLRRITQGILIHAIETETLPIDAPVPEEFASISTTMAFLNFSSVEWDATLPSVQHKLRKYVYTQLVQEANKN